jgi:hypothetical protein
MKATPQPRIDSTQDCRHYFFLGHGSGIMTRLLGLAFVLLLVLSAEAAARCFVPRFRTVSNGTVDIGIQASPAGSCRIRLVNSPGPMNGFVIAQRPSHGTVRIDPIFVFYRSNPGYVGSDSFTYQRSGLTRLGAPTVHTVRVAVTVLP